MAELSAIDASPLIFLSRAELLHLLQRVADEVVVPRPVAEEIERRGPQNPTALALARNRWLQVTDAPPVPSVVQNWDLGPGESSVLAWCLQKPGAEAVIDDLAGRRCAGILGIPVRGTVGLVLVGKKRGRISEARPVLESLRSSGMYLSDLVLNRALRSIGE